MNDKLFTLLLFTLRHPLLIMAYLYLIWTPQDLANPHKRVPEGWWYP